MADDYLNLPGLLAEIAEISGREAALAIAHSYGGTRQGFPTPDYMEANPERYRDNWLVKAVGFDCALSIVKEMFPLGGRVDIPAAKSAIYRQYVLENAHHLSVMEMATFLLVGERAIRRIKAELRARELIV